MINRLPYIAAHFRKKHPLPRYQLWAKILSDDIGLMELEEWAQNHSSSSIDEILRSLTEGSLRNFHKAGKDLDTAFVTIQIFCGEQGKNLINEYNRLIDIEKIKQYDNYVKRIPSPDKEKFVAKTLEKYRVRAQDTVTTTISFFQFYVHLIMVHSIAIKPKEQAAFLKGLMDEIKQAQKEKRYVASSNLKVQNDHINTAALDECVKVLNQIGLDKLLTINTDEYYSELVKDCDLRNKFIFLAMMTVDVCDKKWDELRNVFGIKKDVPEDINNLRALLKDFGFKTKKDEIENIYTKLQTIFDRTTNSFFASAEVVELLNKYRPSYNDVAKQEPYGAQSNNNNRPNF